MTFRHSASGISRSKASRTARPDFKTVDSGRVATRVSVKLGRSSVSSLEVLQVLQVGHQVILSDMSQWDTYERLRLE